MTQPADPSASKPSKRRPRRDRRRERNRERFIEATIALVLEHGSGALSMTSIAERAGMNHRSFYSHFRNADECLKAAMVQVAEARRAQALELRSALQSAGPPDFAVEVALTKDALRGMLEHRSMYLLLLRCRHEQTSMGSLAREEIEHTVEEITEYVWRAGLHHGAGAEHLRELQVLARYIVEGYAATALDVLEGRVKDLDAVAERLTRYHFALMAAELRRLRSETPGDPVLVEPASDEDAS